MDFLACSPASLLGVMLVAGFQKTHFSLELLDFFGPDRREEVLVLRLPIFCSDLLSAMESFIKQIRGACRCNQETEFFAIVETNPVLKEGTRKHLPGPVATFPVADGVVQVLSFPREAADEAMGIIEFTVTLDKGPCDKLGLDVGYWGAMDKLRIKKIKEGLVDKWNLANPRQCVRPGDYIMDINGISGDGKALFQAVTSSQRLVIQITRSSTGAA